MWNCTCKAFPTANIRIIKIIQQEFSVERYINCHISNNIIMNTKLMVIIPLTRFFFSENELKIQTKKTELCKGFPLFSRQNRSDGIEKWSASCVVLSEAPWSQRVLCPPNHLLGIKESSYLSANTLKVSSAKRSHVAKACHMSRRNSMGIGRLYEESRG